MVAGKPFFRGENRFDWLFALTLQTACDWGTQEQVQSVGNLLEPCTVSRFDIGAPAFAPVTLVTMQDFLFVISGSTRNTPQWVGNVLGSVATNVPPSHGSVSTYFGTTAALQLATALAFIQLAATQGKSIVLVGFSLGGASVTIMKDMLSLGYSIPSACVAIASPRAGTTSFTAGFPVLDYAGFMLLHDPVPSVPPSTWAALGIHNSWTPFPPFVTYAHPVTGNTILLDGTISPGYTLQTVDEVVLGFDLGTFQRFHNQAQYAVALRSMEIPDIIPPGYDGYENAENFDSVASEVYSWNSPWPWPKSRPATLEGVSSMTVQSTLYIQNNGPPALGPKEVYYFASDDPSGINAKWLGQWIAARAAFLSKSCQIYAVRSALVGSVKSSYLKKLPQPVIGTQGVTEDIEACFSVFAFNNDRSSKRQFHFRGIDSNWITADALTSKGISGTSFIGNFGFNGVAPTGSGRYLDLLMAGGLAIYAQSTSLVEGEQISAAAKATQDANIVITVPNSYNPPPGTLVEITGVRQAPLMNAVWMTTGPQVAGSITLQGSKNYSCPAEITGIIRTRGLAPLAVTSYEWNGISTKKTGKPSFLQRGRQSVKLRRR